MTDDQIHKMTEAIQSIGDGLMKIAIAMTTEKVGLALDAVVEIGACLRPDEGVFGPPEAN